MSSGEDSNRVPPVRDACAINNVAYGPGHEKYPSWPMAAVAQVPLATKAPPTGGSQRSKSWTDHTDYPKERVVPFTRPYMKRPLSSQSQQLRTVLENCEKTSTEAYNYHHHIQKSEYLGSHDIPERDIDYKNMQRFNRSNGVLHRDSCDDLLKKSQLTQAELEEYTRNLDELNIQHQKQPSYAQSEGYHSYVSSTDSTSTPFLDRLRRDIESTNVRNTNSWDRDSVVTTSSGSASSSETLKWHGSLSDVSVASSSFHPGRQQLIAHSARVQTPQRHNSESILYISNGDNLLNGKNSQKLFPIATYTLQRPPSENKHLQQRARSLYCSPPSPQRSVAERVHQYEKQATKYSYLDPDKKTKLSDPALKAIQKKALLMFYERHQVQTKTESDSKSNSNPSSPEKKLSSSSSNMLDQYYKKNVNRTSNIDEHKNYPPSLSQNDDKDKIQWSSPVKQKETFEINEQFYLSQTDHQNGKKIDGEFYVSNSFNNKVPRNKPEFQNSVSQSSVFNEMSVSYKTTNPKPTSMYELSDDRYNEKKNVHESEVNKNVPINSTNDTHESHNTALQGPIILGPSISLDDWVPERPPKNQQLLRSAFPDLYQQSSPPRMPSPELPPPPLPLCEDDNISVNDEPFPPPPLEIVNDWKPQQNLPPAPTDIKNTRYSVMKENKQPVPMKSQNPENLPLHRVKRNPLPPLKPVPLKREYPSTKSKTNEAVRRNSFANSLDVSRDVIIRNTSLRSSVMERGNSQACPQKPVAPSHRNLRRSITVDESNNKKPINPFLRSTSMKTDILSANRRSSGDFSAHCINFDKINAAYNHNKQATLNGNMSFNSNEKLNRNLSHFRVDSFNKTSTLENVRLKKPDLLENTNTENHIIMKQSLLPSTISERDYRIMVLQKNSFDNKQLSQNSHNNGIIPKTSFSECTSTKADMGLQRAVPLSHYLKKELLSPPQASPESNLKKHHTLSSENLTDNSKSDPSKLSVFKFPNNSEEKHSIEVSKIKSDDKIDSKELTTQINSNNKENERSTSAVPVPTLETNKEVKHSKNNSLDLAKSEPKSSKIQTSIQTLKPRRKLPAEIEWCKIYASLISILPKDSHLVGLISQYEVYNNTIRTVSESFEIEISTPCESLQEYYIKKVTKSDSKPIQQNEKRNLTNEDPVVLMAEAKQCLLKLKIQLNEEILKLQKCQENNDKLKNELLELLPKNNKILRYTEDIGGVVSLIMMIKSRLALYSSPTPILNTIGEQKVAIEAKQAKLLEKLQDAKELKESIDKRGTILLESLFNTNDTTFMAKYHFYIGEKIRLVVYNKDIKYNQELVSQLIKFLEENN